MPVATTNPVELETEMFQNRRVIVLREKNQSAKEAGLLLRFGRVSEDSDGHPLFRLAVNSGAGDAEGAPADWPAPVDHIIADADDRLQDAQVGGR
jgi:hypothetical protein